MAGHTGWAPLWARWQATLAGVSLRPGLGVEGWQAWLRLGRGWEGLTGVDGGQRLRGNYLAKTKDTGYSPPENGNESGMNEGQGQRGDGLARAGQRTGRFDWPEGREVGRQFEQDEDQADN